MWCELSSFIQVNENNHCNAVRIVSDIIRITFLLKPAKRKTNGQHGFCYFGVLEATVAEVDIFSCGIKVTRLFALLFCPKVWKWSLRMIFTVTCWVHNFPCRIWVWTLLLISNAVFAPIVFKECAVLSLWISVPNKAECICIPRPASLSFKVVLM